MKQKKVLILGATGMFGHTVLRYLSENPEYEVAASARSIDPLEHLPADILSKVIHGVDVANYDVLCGVLTDEKPDVVINCIGMVKQLPLAKDPLMAIPINSIFPHRLARLCSLIDARLIHISTDCVFNGSKGDYVETDVPDALDLYGRSKLLGEVDYPNAVTIRTSIIGHELGTKNGLVEWFLAQKESVRGFTKAIFSGTSTVELSRVVGDFVISNPELRGVYHVSSDPISKYDLLHLIATEYGVPYTILPDETMTIDRSLNSQRFRDSTGYLPPSWPELCHAMRSFA